MGGHVFFYLSLSRANVKLFMLIMLKQKVTIRSQIVSHTKKQYIKIKNVNTKSKNGFEQHKIVMQKAKNKKGMRKSCQVIVQQL